MRPMILTIFLLINCVSAIYTSDEKIDHVIWVSNGGLMESLHCPVIDNTSSKDIMYNWEVKDYHEYELGANPSYNLTNNLATLTITRPITFDDAGIYRCKATNGYGFGEITYLVKIRDAKARLLCAQGVLCFSDPEKFSQPAKSYNLTPDAYLELDCSAFTRQFNKPVSSPIHYQWYYGHTPVEQFHGPRMIINKVRLEHSGKYSCSVTDQSNNILSYTFNLSVKLAINDQPVIMTHLKDMVLSSNMSATISAQIKCPCEEPIGQWLKRVEPHEMNHILNKKLLPNPDPEEANEYYYLLENHPNHLIYIEPITLDNSYEFDPHNHVKVFKAKLKLIGPLINEVHGGKYVLITTNKDSINNPIIYEAFTVSINSNKKQVPSENRGNNLIYYFLIPFILFFLILVLGIYCYVTRRNKKSMMTLDSISGHWISGRMLNSSLGDHERYLKNPSQFNSFQATLQSPYSLLKSNANLRSSSHSQAPSNEDNPGNHSAAYYSNSNSSNEYKYPIPSSNYNAKTLSTTLFPYEQQYEAVSTINTSSSHNTNQYSVPCYENETNNNPFLLPQTGNHYMN